MDNVEKGITITYETIYELLRREKDRLDLQKLDSSFYNDLVEYLKNKANLANNSSNTFSEEERQKTEKQLANIKRMIKELYERRERKIVSIAVDKSKSSSDMIDRSAMLENEELMFNSLVKVLASFRESILLKVIDTQLPVKIEEKTIINVPKFELQPTSQELPKEEKPVEERPTKIIRFSHAVPKFLGLDEEEFGPFSEEDIASLPTKIAEVLINKGRAEEIREE